jgi:hypothetical protein
MGAPALRRISRKSFIATALDDIPARPPNWPAS